MISNNEKKLAKIIIDFYDVDLRHYDIIRSDYIPNGITLKFNILSKKGFEYISNQLNKIKKIKGVNSIEILEKEKHINFIIKINYDSSKINPHNLAEAEVKYMMGSYL